MTEQEVERVDSIHCYSCDGYAEVQTEWNQEMPVQFCPFCGEQLDDREEDFHEEMLEQIEDFDDSE